MATTTQNLGTSTAATITIASLANAGGRASTAIDNSTAKCTSADIYLKYKTGASGTSATGYVDVYLVRSEDGTNYEDGFGGTDSAFTPVNSQKIGMLYVSANATTYYGVFNTSVFGELPRKFCIGLVNNTGSAADSTAGNHTLSYTLKKFDTA